MGWQRRAGQRYFYRCLRIGGRPRRVYYGRGEAAEEQARLEVERRQERQAERAALVAELAQVASADRALEALRALAGLLARASLIVAGLHEHHGEWRRRTMP